MINGWFGPSLKFYVAVQTFKPEYFQLGQSHSDDEWTIRVALFDQAVDTKSGQLLSLINEHIFTFFRLQSVDVRTFVTNF